MKSNAMVTITGPVVVATKIQNVDLCPQHSDAD